MVPNNCKQVTKAEFDAFLAGLYSAHNRWPFEVKVRRQQWYGIDNKSFVHFLVETKTDIEAAREKPNAYTYEFTEHRFLVAWESFT